MPLRIAFDMDGVLADMDERLAREAEQLFGERISRRTSAPSEPPPAPKDSPSGPAAASQTASGEAPPPLKLELSDRQTRRLWRHVEAVEGFWESLSETEPGVTARLAALASDRRWEIIFLTRRPESAGAMAQVQTQRWLESKGFTLPSVFVVQGSRGHIAAALNLDIVVDDTPENCLDVVVDSRARAILVWREDAKLLPAAARRLGIGVVHSVAECLEILTHIDAAPHDRPGVIDRVLRLLGLKSEAAGCRAGRSED